MVRYSLHVRLARRSGRDTNLVKRRLKIQLDGCLYIQTQPFPSASRISVDPAPGTAGERGVANMCDGCEAALRRVRRQRISDDIQRLLR